MNLYKNGDVEVINLTDGTFYANKDVDTEVEILENSSSATRSELQTMVEDLKKEVKDIKEENIAQATEINNLKNSIKESGENCATKTELESISTLVKTNQTNINTNKMNISSLTTKMNGLGKETKSAWGTTKAVPNSATSYTVLDTIQIPSAGSYIISVLVHVPTFSDSLFSPKHIGISSQTTFYTSYNDQFYGQNFYAHYYTISTSDEKIYILARQTSGSPLDFTVYISLIRVGY